jgi:hypothetical protein
MDHFPGILAQLSGGAGKGGVAQEKREQRGAAHRLYVNNLVVA